jgi:hypothetical protein
VHPTPRTIALTELALVALDRGEYGTAATLLGCAAAVRDAIGAPVFPSERGDVERATATARSALGAERYATAFERGRHLNPGEAGYGVDHPYLTVGPG